MLNLPIETRFSSTKTSARVETQLSDNKMLFKEFKGKTACIRAQTLTNKLRTSDAIKEINNMKPLEEWTILF